MKNTWFVSYLAVLLGTISWRVCELGVFTANWTNVRRIIESETQTCGPQAVKTWIWI